MLERVATLLDGGVIQSSGMFRSMVVEGQSGDQDGGGKTFFSFFVNWLPIFLAVPLNIDRCFHHAGYVSDPGS